MLERELEVSTNVLDAIEQNQLEQRQGKSVKYANLEALMADLM